MTVVLERLDPGSDHALALIAELDGYLLGLYPPESNHLDSVEELSRPHVHCIGAFENSRAIGCGAVKLLDGYAEIKRIYINPKYRGKGVGGRILSELEDISRHAGLDIVRLETGVRQPQAMLLFESKGYCKTGRFADYPDDPLSVFMKKRLRARTTANGSVGNQGNG